MKNILLGLFLVPLLIFTLMVLSTSISQHSYLSAQVPKHVTVPYSQSILLDGMIFNNRLRHLIPRNADYKKLFSKRKLIHMPDQSARLVKLAQEGNQAITIRINSKGGLVTEGLHFIRIMNDLKSAGIHITCVVDRTAMSMAASIFSHCSTRYATLGSTIMWHSAYSSGMYRLNQFRAKQIYDNLVQMNNDLWSQTRSHFSQDFFETHFKQETVHSARDLEQIGHKYLRIINSLQITDMPQPPAKKGKTK